MHFWPGNFAGVDVLLQFEIGVGLKGAGGADGSHASGKVQSRKAESHFPEDRVAHGIEHVIVHADQAGNDSVLVEVESLSIFGKVGVRGVGDGLDLSLAQDDGLVLARGRARAVDNAHVS